MPQQQNPNFKTPYDFNRKKYQPATRRGCSLCPEFHCRYIAGVNCSVEKHSRDQHPEVSDWQQHVVTWGKRFFNGDGTSHDVSCAELDKNAVCIDDDDGDNQAQDDMMGKQEGGGVRLAVPPALGGPVKNVKHVQTRFPTERSIRLAVPSRSIASFPPYPTLSFPARTQARTQVQSPSYQAEAPSTPPSPPTISPELLTDSSPFQIGSIDQWVLDGQYDRQAPILQSLARKVLLTEADDMRSSEERQRDEDRYKEWFNSVMEFEARRLNFPRHQWPHP